MQSLAEMIVKTRRLRSASHVLKQSDDRPATVAMILVPEGGKRTSELWRTRCRHQKTWCTTFS